MLTYKFIKWNFKLLRDSLISFLTVTVWLVCLPFVIIGALFDR